MESRDIVVTITTTEKAHDNYWWCDDRIQRLESTFARFVKGFKGDTLTDVAGKYSMDEEQMAVFDSLNKKIMHEARKLKMYAY